ncbi:uncharacterized protein RCO7_14477 [Rhynchosporium graminicola]|uniref:Uncharacterized protein n=1 Tax=Rhynchosporium graminicola TaxID=2792576 RepID=A0A1E1KJW2_9HELO|nr:uncharacterized protein RCO7_14477 [Rhynchosporium commune]
MPSATLTTLTQQDAEEYREVFRKYLTDIDIQTTLLPTSGLFA